MRVVVFLLMFFVYILNHFRHGREAPVEVGLEGRYINVKGNKQSMVPNPGLWQPLSVILTFNNQVML